MLKLTEMILEGSDPVLVQYVQIASFDNTVSASMTLGLLQENELDCHLRDDYIITIDPLLNPAIGGIKLMVADWQAEKAQALIREAAQLYINTIPCPACKKKALVLEEKYTLPASIWAKIKNRLLYGQESIFSRKYHCQDCGHVFTELPDQF